MPRNIVPAGADPTAIGEVSAPPFARLPDPTQLFARRAQRFEALARAHKLGPYLRFLGELAGVQHAIQDGLPEPELPEADARERARSFGMPPLDRNRFAPSEAYETLDRLTTAAAAIEKPAAAAAALDRLRRAEPAERDAIVRNVLADAIAMEALAEHVYVAAALQVHFARLASGLDAKRLVPVGDGVCPACGGPPVASLIVEWPNAHGSRFCVCSLCSTFWNYVRIRCCSCGTTKGIGYQEVEGGPGTVKAETCDECHTYVKVMYQNKDTAIEPVADDIGSLALDMLMRDGPYRRAAFNPFLLGY